MGQPEQTRVQIATKTRAAELDVLLNASSPPGKTPLVGEVGNCIQDAARRNNISGHIEGPRWMSVNVDLMNVLMRTVLPRSELAQYTNDMFATL